MVKEILDPCEVGAAEGRRAELPAQVVAEAVAAPVTHIEGRIGEHEVGFKVFVDVAIGYVGGFLVEIPFDAAVLVGGGQQHGFGPEGLPVPGIRALGVVASFQESSTCLTCQFSVCRIADGEGG